MVGPKWRPTCIKMVLNFGHTKIGIQVMRVIIYQTGKSPITGCFQQLGVKQTLANRGPDSRFVFKRLLKLRYPSRGQAQSQYYKILVIRVYHLHPTRVCPSTLIFTRAYTITYSLDVFFHPSRV